MTIGFITTSRADFGIYIPLLEKIVNSSTHRYLIFAGGMHTSERFGMSFNLIEKQGFKVAEKINSDLEDDSELGISQSMGVTMSNYASVWSKYKHELDVVICLGDRFEMFAAAASLVPYNIRIAHFHGGETTLGAIDEKFRYAITAISDLHFTSHKQHAENVVRATGSEAGVYNVGALSIDYILKCPLLDTDQFIDEFNFDISQPYVLTTYHPETVDLNNQSKVEALIEAIDVMDHRVLCTLPNADTEGMVIREAFLDYESRNSEKIKCFENLGQRGYFTAMKNSSFLLGNTSSGIIEAASFNKPVVNVGDRQKGRVSSDNVIHVPNEKNSIIDGAKIASDNSQNSYINVYGQGNTASQIMELLEENLNI